MKKTDHQLDKLIKNAVKSVDLPLPEKLRTPSLRKRRFRYAGLTGLVAAAAALIILFPAHVKKSTTRNIKEIRTELTLQNKNIKILWVQKADFQLPESMRGGKEK